MAVKVKRRAGGGRKPQGPISNKTETFSTRISPALRKALEREARETGHSISQVAESLLRIGLSTKAKARSDRPLRALLFLIEQLADRASGSRIFRNLAKTDAERALAAKRGSRWRNDRFRYEAFKVAVVKLLDLVAINRPMISPWEKERQGYEEFAAMTNDWTFFETAKDEYSTPSKFGTAIFARLQFDIFRQAEFSNYEQEIMKLRPELERMIQSERYGILDARRDLDLLSKNEWREK